LIMVFFVSGKARRLILALLNNTVQIPNLPLTWVTIRIVNTLLT
jgi:hypothetical protein